MWYLFTHYWLSICLLWKYVHSSPKFFPVQGPYLLFLCALFLSFLCWSFLFILFWATPSGTWNSFLTLFQDTGRTQRTIWGSRNHIWVCLVQDKCHACYAIYLVPYYCSLQVIYIIWILALKKYLEHIVIPAFYKIGTSFLYLLPLFTSPVFTIVSQKGKDTKKRPKKGFTLCLNLLLLIVWNCFLVTRRESLGIQEN